MTSIFKVLWVFPIRLLTTLPKLTCAPVWSTVAVTETTTFVSVVPTGAHLEVSSLTTVTSGTVRRFLLPTTPIYGGSLPSGAFPSPPPPVLKRMFKNMLRKQSIVGMTVVPMILTQGTLINLVTRNVVVFTIGGTSRLLAEVVVLIVFVKPPRHFNPPTTGTAKELDLIMPVMDELETAFRRVEETIVIPVGLFDV